MGKPTWDGYKEQDPQRDETQVDRCTCGPMYPCPLHAEFALKAHEDALGVAVEPVGWDVYLPGSGWIYHIHRGHVDWERRLRFSLDEKGYEVVPLYAAPRTEGEET